MISISVVQACVLHKSPSAFEQNEDYDTTFMLIMSLEQQAENLTWIAKFIMQTEGLQVVYVVWHLS